MGDDLTETMNEPRVFVGGEAVAGGTLAAFREAAATLQDADLSARIAGESEILDLSEAGNESAFLDLLLKRYGTRTQLDFSRMPRPPVRGLKGTLLAPIRRVFWSLMRWPHDWAAFQQNAVNEQAAKALALAVQHYRRENVALLARIEALEQARDAGHAAGGKGHE